jgi:hypothetical protein
MFAGFFDTTTTIELADWIVAELKRAVPPDLGQHEKKHMIRAKQMEENIAKRVVDFSRSTRLNVYKKARLAARVREGMSALGYPESFVTSFSYELVARLQAAEKSRTA